MPIFKLFKKYLSKNRTLYKRLRMILGYWPRNISLYVMAFKHKSANEVHKNGIRLSNERLEFLGDAILGAVIAELLFKQYPYKDEGFLTEMRSKIVSRNNLNHLAKKMGFETLMTYDKKNISLYNKQSSMLGDAFEALIGAVYLDKGYESAKDFVIKRIIDAHVDIQQLEDTETNFKSRLIEWCQRNNKTFSYELVPNDEGENKKLFTINVIVDGNLAGIGKDYNKKNAEKLASEKACEALSI